MQREAYSCAQPACRGWCVLCAGLALCSALLAVRAALADEQSTASTVAADEPTSSSRSTAATALQEVIVTATRRSEGLNRVPESIVVLDASQIDAKGIRSAEDLISQAPGVDLSTVEGIATNISIRGISNTSGVLTTGPATTGIYLDDTPVQIRSIGNGPGNPLPDVFDLDRVEVLRGPQGTLFGAGSEGGAIRFIFPEPDLENWSGYRRAELGFTDNGGASYDIGAAEGGPILDGTLGFRASAHDRHDGGFVDRIPYPDGAGPDPAESNANYTDTQSARAALLWTPTEELKILPALYFQRIYVNDIGQYWLMLSDTAARRYISGNGESSPDDDRSTLASIKVEWTHATFDLIADTAYYSRDENNFTDWRALITNTFGPLLWSTTYPGLSNEQILQSIFSTPGYYDNGLILNTQRDWTQELRLQSADAAARVTWLAGLFYEDNRQLNYENNRTPFLNLETGLPGSADAASIDVFGIPLLQDQYIYEEQIVTHDKQLAAFADVDFKLTSHLKLTTGLRAARTEVDFLDTANGPLAGGPSFNEGKHLETPKTPRYVMTYQFNPDDMVYASLADGFRVGGVNKQISTVECGPELAALGFTSAPKTYNSDRVKSYEIGAKVQPASVLRIAASIYYIDWFSIIQPIDLVNCSEGFTGNLGTAVSRGADLEITFVPTSRVVLGLSTNYNDAAYTQTIRNPGAPFNLVKDGWSLGQTPWTIVGSGEYTFPGPREWSGYLRSDVDFRSRNGGLTALTDPTSAQYDPLLRPSPSTLDVRLRVGARRRGWDVSLYANNALDQHPMLNLGDDAVGGAVRYATPIRPLTAGVTVQSRF